MLNLIN